MKMNSDERIIKILSEIQEDLALLKDNYYLIGSSALMLSGIPIDPPKDIDLLLSKNDALFLQEKWADKINPQHIPKDGQLFRSTFTRYDFETMTVEIMGDLEIFSNGIWRQLKIEAYSFFELDDYAFKIPTLKEQLRILHLFGREKDVKKIEAITLYLSEKK